MTKAAIIPSWMISLSVIYQAVLTIVQLNGITSFAISDPKTSTQSLIFEGNNDSKNNNNNNPYRRQHYQSTNPFASPKRLKSTIPYTTPVSKSRTKQSALYHSAVVTEEEPSSSSSHQWQHVPTNSLFGNDHNTDAGSILLECDAIVTTLNINENNNDNNDPGSSSSIIDPDIVWIRSMPMHNHNQSSSSKLEAMALPTTKICPSENNNNVPKVATEAISATHRWSSNFVRQLQLCPWAGSSLDTPGAIRYWVLLVNDDVDENNDDDNNHDGDNAQNNGRMNDQSKSSSGMDSKRDWDNMKRHRIASEERKAKILDKMEVMTREAGRHLEQITDESYVDCIDASAAISFVILVDTKTATASSLSGQHGLPAPNSLLPGFGTFHEFFLDLEDRLLDECDEYWDEIDGDDDDDAEDEEGEDSPLGCEITIAAFHPKWQFGNDNSINNDAEGSGAEQSIDFEKRTPYPTLSIVMSTAIDALMKERSANTKNNNGDDGDDDTVDNNVGDENDGSSDNGGNNGQEVLLQSQSAPATERIAALNEKTLEEIGVEGLRHLFDSEVIQCPAKHG